MKNEHDIRVSARTAQLLASDGDEDDGPPYTFSGVAVAAGDILHMDDGTPVLFTEEELRAAAETQTGEPLTKDHPADEEGRPKYPPDVDETIGKVAKAGWLDSVEGVGYEATTHDEAIGQGVQAGSYEVSVHPTFELGEKDPETGAYTAENVRFRDLSVVSKGDSPSNTANFGSNQALASYTRSADIGAELTAAADADGDGGADRQGLVANAVRGTLQALGVDGLEADGSTDTGDEPGGTPGADGSSSDPPMDNETTIKTLVDEHGFSEESLENMSDEDLKRLQESLVESDDGTSTDTSGSTESETNDGDDGGQTLADMTVDDLADGLQQRGFVTEDNATDLVTEAQAQVSKRDKVDEVIAASDDYDEDDREDLLASADALVDREHKRVRGEAAATLPGTAGSLTAAAPGRNDSDNELDAYGTGVQED